MPKPTKPESKFFAGVYINPTEGSEEEYWWDGEPGMREASVIKTDRFGQQWVLREESGQWVTFRVAAGLLQVTVPTVHAWAEEGRFATIKRRFRPAFGATKSGGLDLKNFKRVGVLVLRVRDVERVAKERGMFIHTPLTPGQKRLLKRHSITRKPKKGGDMDADEG